MRPLEPTCDVERPQDLRVRGKYLLSTRNMKSETGSESAGIVKRARGRCRRCGGCGGGVGDSYGAGIGGNK